MGICSKEELAKRIDHTLLRPEASASDILRLCEEASTYHFASVCVQPARVALAVKVLDGTAIPVCSVVGFPHGANLTEIKVLEAAKAQEQGAQELDMVVSLGAIHDANWKEVAYDIACVAKRVHDGGGILKVILECGLLSSEQKRRAAEIAVENGADFLKTSTGFTSGGATLEDVRLLRAIAGTRCRVKAAGGIRNLQTALQMLEAGADRLGCSASLALMKEAQQLWG